MPQLDVKTGPTRCCRINETGLVCLEKPFTAFVVKGHVTNTRIEPGLFNKPRKFYDLECIFPLTKL